MKSGDDDLLAARGSTALAARMKDEWHCYHVSSISPRQPRQAEGLARHWEVSSHDTSSLTHRNDEGQTTSLSSPHAPSGGCDHREQTPPDGTTRQSSCEADVLSQPLPASA